MRPGSLKDAADARERSRRHVAAIVVSLVANAAFAWALFLLTRPAYEPFRPRSLVPRGDALEVRLIDRSADVLPAPALDEIANAPFSLATEARSPKPAKRTERVAVEHVSAERSTASAATTMAAPSLVLFNTDGSVHLGTDGADAGSAPAGLPTESRGDNVQPLARHAPLDYRPTKFDRAWVVPKDESLAGEMTRKATVSHSWRTPWGTQISCVWVIVAGGCGWGRPPQATIEELQAMRADPPVAKASLGP